MAPHASTLPGKSHGRKSLVGCSPWGCEELDTTERLHFHFSLSCIGEGNGSPLQCLASRIPGMGEPGGLTFMVSHRVRHDWSNLAAAAAAAAATTLSWMIEDRLLSPILPLPGEELMVNSSFGCENKMREPTMGSHRVGHDWSDLAAVAAAG